MQQWAVRSLRRRVGIKRNANGGRNGEGTRRDGRRLPVLTVLAGVAFVAIGVVLVVVCVAGLVVSVRVEAVDVAVCWPVTEVPLLLRLAECRLARVVDVPCKLAELFKEPKFGEKFGTNPLLWKRKLLRPERPPRAEAMSAVMARRATARTTNPICLFTCPLLRPHRPLPSSLRWGRPEVKSRVAGPKRRNRAAEGCWLARDLACGRPRADATLAPHRNGKL